MCQLAFLKMTLLTPPPKKVETKSAKKKVKPTPNDVLTSRV